MSYISIKQVLDNILDHPMLKDLSFERALNHTIHFIRIVGCPRIFEEKVDEVDIKDYRGLLPCDFNNIIQVRIKNSNRVFTYSTDSFHMSSNKDITTALTYKVQGNVIYTSIKEGTIEVAYNAFAVDDEGYPLIPDNSFFIRALELYIKKQYFTILFDQEKINVNVYQNVCQEYAWAVGQAQVDLVRLNIDQMQSLTNMLNTLVPRVSEHSKGFATLGSKEQWRVHR